MLVTVVLLVVASSAHGPNNLANSVGTETEEDQVVLEVDDPTVIQTQCNSKIHAHL
jgi:hypothetical protein